MRALLPAAFLLAACGKAPPSPAAGTPSAPKTAPAPARDEGPLFSLDADEPVVPAAPDHSQAHPGPDDALKADRAGLTAGALAKDAVIEWNSEPAPGGLTRVWARAVVVKYRMKIDVFVSSLYAEGTCPYAVTWDHELSHARAYVAMFDASKEHLMSALEASQQDEPAVPTKAAPVLLKPDEAAEFEKRAGEKIAAVINDQSRVLDALMADHKRERDSPEAYRKDTEKCPMQDWRAGQ